MTTEEGLLAAIRDVPEDDLCRLAYADWLDENAGPGKYAAFIRAQVAVARRRERGVSFCPCDPWGRLPSGGDCECDWCAPAVQQYRLWSSAINDIADMPARGLSWVTTADWIFDPKKAYPREGIAIVRRGFVDEVRLPLGLYLGGPCERCGGCGELTWPSEDGGSPPMVCPDCRSTGTTTGLAGPLFTAHPITQVRPTDCTPFYYRGDLRETHGWIDGYHDFTTPYYLPPSLYLALDRSDCVPSNQEGFDGGRDGWLTAQAAIDALSRVLVAIGRERRVLPDTQA